MSSLRIPVRSTVLAALVLSSIAACAATARDTTSDVAPGGADAATPPSPFGGNEAGGPCTGLRCAVPTCAAGTTTAIEGDLYDPAGKQKLYGGIAYVPNAEPEALPTGATCDRCGTVTGDPIATALSNEKGHFRIEGVPAGKDVPVVLQIGKWRRTIVIPQVEACATTTIVDGEARLPRNQSEGQLPQIAVVTGGFDELGCLLTRIGVDGTEYTAPGGYGRIHIYEGEGGGGAMSGTTPKATALWNDATALAKYDMVLLACEGWEYDEDDPNGNKTAASKQLMHDYAAAGGKIFATHYHYAWFKKSPQADFRDVATWNAPSSAYGHKTLQVDTTFPKGVAFGKWLVESGASATPGSIEVDNPGSNVASVNSKTAQRWLYTENPANVAYMSFNVPVGAPPAEQCGRATFSDIHVSGENGGRNIPGNCGSAKLTPQELALEFLLFDLASCVIPDSQAPSAPPPR